MDPPVVSLLPFRCQPAHNFDAVVAAAQTGEEWAVRVVFRMFNPALVRYLRAQVPAVSDDLAGEVWLAVATQLPRLEGGEQALRAWLFTIARRRVADHRRQAVRRRTDPVPHADLVGRSGGTDPADLVTDNLSAQAAIDHMVALLPASQAEVVLLRVVGGLDVAEVATILGRSPGWVRVTQHRALRRLAEHVTTGRSVAM